MRTIHLAFVARLRYTIVEVMNIKELPKYYTTLFAAATEAITELEARQPAQALMILTKAVRESEELYIQEQEQPET